MPLCSCGVIPVTLSLRDKGASNGATASFLTSTPQTGVDSFLATYAMLGPVFAVYKLFVSFFSGIFVGLAVELFGGEDRRNRHRPPPALSRAAPAPFSSMRSPALNPKGAAASAPAQQPTWTESFRYGLVTMPGDIAGALLLGFILAGVISALAPADLLSLIPGGAVTAILIAPAITVPLYICSTGSIPLALALVHSGLPIGAALVLLVAGPATSIATITTMRKVLGGRQTAVYVAGVIVTAWTAAFVYEQVFGNAGLTGIHEMEHIMDLPLWKHLSGIALIALLVVPFIRSKFRTSKPQLEAKPLLDAQTATIEVSGMTCSHCEKSVRDGLASLPFVKQILSVDRNRNQAILQGDNFDESAIRQKLESLGFDYHGYKLG